MDFVKTIRPRDDSEHLKRLPNYDFSFVNRIRVEVTPLQMMHAAENISGEYGC